MAKPIGWRRVRRYTPEFKLQAVKLTKVDGVKVGDVAEAIRLSPPHLRTRRRRAFQRTGLALRARPAAERQRWASLSRNNS
jgi:transposase-like protein